MGKKIKVGAKVTTSATNKAVKPKMGKGTGGIMTTSVKLMVKDIKDNKNG